MEKKILSNSKGVTMIALVVTIVILLILAGISIAMFTRSKLVDTAFESKIVTELSQLGEEVNKIKVQGEQELIQEGIYSGSVTNDTLINKQIVISTATINNPSIKLGIIDISKFNVDSELGKNFSSYSSDSTFNNITDLSDVYAINLETNDIYYINKEVYTVKGTVPPEELIKPIVTTDGPTVSITRNTEETENLKFTITASKGKDNIDLKEDNKYEYYLSTKPNDIVGGEWKEYISGQEELVEKTGNREYYIFVKIIEDKNDKISTAIGTNGTEVLVGGEKYHRFGPYEIDNGSILIIDPNGGKYKNSDKKTTIKGKNNNSIIINSNDISIDKTITVNFNSNGGNTVNTIKTSATFDSWTFSGSGKFENNVYTFGEGTGTLTANYKISSIILPSPTKTGNTFGGWYTDSGCTQIAGNAGEQYIPTTDVTLYAKWNINQYTLTVNPNGGTWNNTTSNSTFTQNYGTTKEISNPTVAPKGYTITFNTNGGSTVTSQTSTKSFDKWSLSGAGSISGTTFTFGAGNTTLTANYKNDSITLPTPTKTGSTFAGWYTNSECTESAGNAGASYTPTKDITLYAKWDTNKYTLTINPNGGTWNNSTDVQEYEQDYGTIKEIPNPTVAPKGYTITFNTNGGSAVASQTSTKSFTNWALSGAGSISGTTFTFGAGNTTLTANYKNDAMTLPTPTRTGYTFVGWYTDSTLQNSAGTSFTATTNTTLYAKWTINKYYIDLNFNVDGKSYGQGYEERILVGLRINGDDKGYVKDYYQEHNYGAKWEIYGLRLDGVDIAYTDSGTLGSEKLSITKYFYTITFNANNGTYGTVSPTSLIVPNNNTKYTTNSNTLTLSDGRKVTATVTNTSGYTTTFTNWTTSNKETTSGTITGATTITANFNRTANSYTAKFDSNGGTTATPSSITKKYGEKLGTLPTTSKTGYTFAGWFTSATGGTQITENTTMPINGATYYAHWNLHPYTLTINPNGGTWNNSADVQEYEQDYGTSKEIPNPTAPKGYTITFNTNGGSTVASQTSTKSFTNWSLSGAGSLSGTTFTFGAGNTTLTANYKNNSITLPTPTKTGSTFAGWYTDSALQHSAGNEGESYTPTANITLYAKWTINKYYIDLNFNVDGKSYGQGFEDRILVGLRIDGDDKGYIKDYYQEHNYGAKWEIYGLRLDGVDIAYTDSGTLGAANLSLTKYFYTVTFNVNNSSYGTVSPTSLIVPNNNTKYTTSSNTLTLSDGRKVTATVTNENGYTTTFTNWTTSNKETTSGTITGATTITANFNRTVNTYTAKFDSNGGATATPSSITKKYGEKLGTLPTTSRTGYTFAGWFTSATGGTQITADTTMPVNGATYYAHWNINQYTLTVNPNGGTWNNTTENSTFKQNYGTTKAIANPTAPTGYKVTFNTNGGNTVANQTSTKSFTNWSLSGKGSLNGTTFTFKEGDATLTANYKNNSITLPTPTKTGHTFAGWYTNSECTQSAGNSGEQYTPTKDITLYAKWNIKQYKIDLNFNVDGTPYYTGYEDRIYVKLRIAGVDTSYVKDFGSSYNYGTKWEIIGLKLDNVEIPYTASGTLGAENLNLMVYFYTITFNVNNGNYGKVSPTSLIVPNNNTKYTTSNNTLTLGDGRKATATVTNESGYTTAFTNWTIKKGTTIEATTDGTITGTTTITANFNRTANTYTVKFDSNGGNTVNPSSITKKFGEKLGTLPTTSRTGYTFAGWFTSATGGTQITADTTMPVNGATYYAHWNINQYTLTVNPNGGTWNNTTENSTFKQNYGTTKTISNPTAPTGYKVTFNTNGGNTVADQTSTKSFDKWTSSGSGNYSTSVNKPSSSGMSVSESSENGEKVYKFSYTANNPSVNTWYYSRFSPYTYTSGDTYEIRFKVRVNSVSNGGNITFRHSALANDYGTPGLKTQTFKATTSGWVDVSLERTISGTTTTLSNKTVNIAPVFEFYTSNLLNTTASISFDIKGLEIINKTKHTLLQSMDNKYLFGNGNGTLTANYKNNSITLPTPTKTGYTFAGWYTNSECTQSAGNSGEQYTPTKNITLYAKWNVNKYYIDLNLNVDGTGYGQGYEERIYVKLKVAGVDKGYVKDYYAEHDYGTKWEITGLKLDNIEIPYSDSGTLGAEKLNITKYFYTITFNVNNGSYGSISPTSLIVPNNNTKYTTSSNTLTLGDGRKVTATVTNLSGYTTTFANWTIKKGTTSEATTSGTITGTTIITANFNRTTNSYTATFNSNGGNTANPSSITKKFGEKLGTLPTTSRTGYTFAGWFTSATGGTQITADTTMPVNGATYYAHWNINQYTLTVNPNGGTWNNTTENSTFKQNYGTTKTISNPTVAPKGYTVTFSTDGGSEVTKQTSTKSFTNWSLSGKGSLNGTTFTFGEGDGTLTANYKNNSIKLPTPTKTGHTFAGWYTNSECTQSAGNAGEQYTPTKDITLYAKWQANKYNITFDNNNYLTGLTDVGSTVSDRMTYSVSNQVVTVTANNDDGYGYINARVYLEADKTYVFSCNTSGAWPSTTEAFLMLNGTTATAYYHMASNNGHTFTPKSSGIYYLRLDVNVKGQTHTFSNIKITEKGSTQSKTYGTTLGTLPTPSRPFFTFAGWYTSPAGGTQVTASTATPATNTTYYAHWTEQGNSARVENVTSKGYDVYLHTTDSNVATVRVPTWTDYNSQDDLLQPWTSYYLATKQSQNYYYFRVNVTDHNSESGLYHSHVYGYNSSGGQVFSAIPLTATVPVSPISISFSPNGNSTFAKTQSSTITANSSAGGLSVLKYIWIQGTGKLTDISHFNGGVNISSGYTATATGVTGDWYLWIYAQDDLGNEKIACSNVFKFDNTAPSIPTVIYNGGANTCTWKNNYNITLSSSDSHSGVDHYEVDWSGDGVSEQVVSSNFIPWNNYSSCTNRFRAVDKAGNVSAWTEPHHIHMDTEAPSITTVNLNGYASGTWTASNVTQTASATDNIVVSYYQYSNNGGATVYNFPNPFVINWDGAWDFYVRAVDAAGNVGPWSAMYTIRRDSVAPTVNSLSATAISASSYRITVNSSDTGGSGLRGFYASTSSATPSVSSSWNGGTTFNASPSTTYYVWAIDNAGNISAVHSITTAAINYSVHNTRWCTNLNQAISLAGGGNTIYLLRDLTDNTTATLSGKSVYFTPYGHTLTRNVTITVNSGCTFVINGSGKISSNTTIITNKGNFKAEGPTLTTSGAVATIRAYSNGYTNITGGTIYNTNTSVNSLASCIIGTGGYSGTISASGCTIAAKGADSCGIIQGGHGNVTINCNMSSPNNCVSINNGSKASLIVNGGNYLTYGSHTTLYFQPNTTGALTFNNGNAMQGSNEACIYTNSSNAVKILKGRIVAAGGVALYRAGTGSVTIGDKNTAYGTSIRLYGKTNAVAFAKSGNFTLSNGGLFCATKTVCKNATPKSGRSGYSIQNMTTNNNSDFGTLTLKDYINNKNYTVTANKCYRVRLKAN